MQSPALQSQALQADVTQRLERPAGEVAHALILLGATGDLARRMLWPSLLHLDADGLLADDLVLFGVARQNETHEAFRAGLRADMARFEKVEAAVLDRFLARIRYVPCDVTKAEGAAHLAQAVGQAAQITLFFALSPSLYAATCASLKAAGLIVETTRLVLEKPIGRDLESSKAINRAVAAVAREEQVFRIDHYLGKETVQNLIALRFANTFFEPLWTGRTIDHVQITIAETEGIGERWPYYDDYGAARDMVQNHMLQLLCLVAMEPPSDLDPESVRTEKVKVLRSLRPFTHASAQQHSVRGQYQAGPIDGAVAAAYVDEVGRPTNTETFVALRCEIDNWRWAGVPFFLRTGKRMAERRTKIVIQFKPVPHSIFAGAGSDDLSPNRLVIDLQPDEDIKLTLMNKRPGLDQGGMRLQNMPLSLSLSSSYGGQGGRRRIAYERLLLDVFRGDRTLFVRRDEVEQAWTFIDGLEKAWAEAQMSPKPYLPGSWGPSGASGLTERSGRSWVD
jgi:glucose-6-phosphate 1-dehydrogenase